MRFNGHLTRLPSSLSGRRTALSVGVVVFSLAMAGLGLADEVNVDNDLVLPGNQNIVSVTTTAGATVNTSMQIVVSYQGSKHLATNQNLTFTNNGAVTNLPSGYTAPNITVAIGNSWAAGSTAANSGTLSFTAPGAGVYSYTVKYNDPASVSCASSPCLGGSASETINVTVLPTPPTCDTTPPDAPTVTAVSSPDPASGWYNAAAGTAGFTVAPDVNAEYSLDNGTTWVPYSSEVDFATDGQYSVIARNFKPATGSCDRVDGSASSSIEFDVDRAAPMITDAGLDSGTAGNNGWYTSPVTEDFAASDDTSGLADCPTSFTKTSGISEEGSSVTIPSGPCSDDAGNTNPGINSVSYMIDLTAPTVSHAIGSPNFVSGSDTFVTSVTGLTVSVADAPGGSGVDTCTIGVSDATSNPTCAAGDNVFNLDSALFGATPDDGAYTVTGDAADVAGNNATQDSFGVVLDNMGPTVSLTCPPAHVPVGASLSANWTADDGAGSGVATGYASGSIPVPVTPGAHVIQVAAGASRDNLGNVSAASNSCAYGAFNSAEVVGLSSASISANGVAVDGYPPTGAATGTVASNGTITLSGAQINGTITNGTVVYQKSASVSGGETHLGTLNADAVSLCSPFSSKPVGLGGDKLTYDGNKGDLTVSGGNSLHLAPADYCFHNVTISGGSKLYVSGPTRIDLTGQFNGSGGSLINETGDPANLQISTNYSGNNAIVLSGTTKAYALLYAPSGGVTLSGGSPLYGAVLGKTLVMSGSSVVHCDTDSDVLALWQAHFS